LITGGEIGEILTYHQTDHFECIICSQTNAELSSALEKAEWKTIQSGIQINSAHGIPLSDYKTTAKAELYRFLPKQIMK
jgi:hypothetical protein